MSGSLAVIDFLNSREKAALLWTIPVIVFAAIKSDGLLGSFASVLKAFASPKLLLLFGSAAAYVAALIFLGSAVGLWETSATKATVYWFFGTGAILVGRALLVSPDDPAFLRRLLRGSLKLTILVEFTINLYVFPLVVELLFVPLLAVLVMLEVVAGSDASYADVRKLVDGALAVIGIGLLIYVLVAIFTDLSGFWTRKNAEDFLAPPVLTLTLVPFLALVALVSKREQDNLRRRWRTTSNSTAQ